MKDWAFEFFVWGCFILYLTLIGAILTGCTNQYDACIEKEKAEYRARNPKASYSQITSRQQDFEMMCSRFKNS
jgi:hypothetical protein